MPIPGACACCAPYLTPLEAVFNILSAFINLCALYCMALQAAVLGYSLRQRLVHAVRQEYRRVLQEVEGESASTLACREIQWPSKGALCFPRHVDTVGSVTEHSISLSINHLTVEGEPGIEQLTERAGEDGGMESLKNPQQVDGGDGVIHKASAREDGGVGDAAQMDHDVPGLPMSHSKLHSSAMEYSAKGALCPTHHSDRGSPPVASQSSPSCSSDRVLDTGVMVWLDSAQTGTSELPRDREQLLELRTQLAMELLWIKQAIASRQKVRKHFSNPFQFLIAIPFYMQYLKLKQKISCQQE